MQWIKLVPEDAGIQNLRIDNKRPAVTRDVNAVAPYPRTQKTGPGHDENARRTGAVRDRRKGDRRKGGNRRKKQVPVLLDTRSKHDRRAIGNRRLRDALNSPAPDDATETPETTARKPLDLYV